MPNTTLLDQHTRIQPFYGYYRDQPVVAVKNTRICSSFTADMPVLLAHLD